MDKEVECANSILREAQFTIVAFLKLAVEGGIEEGGVIAKQILVKAIFLRSGSDCYGDDVVPE